MADKPNNAWFIKYVFGVSGGMVGAALLFAIAQVFFTVAMKGRPKDDLAMLTTVFTGLLLGMAGLLFSFIARVLKSHEERIRQLEKQLVERAATERDSDAGSKP